jgi:hypothetical protein
MLDLGFTGEREGLLVHLIAEISDFFWEVAVLCARIVQTRL